jgi:hypothetical protein
METRSSFLDGVVVEESRRLLEAQEMSLPSGMIEPEIGPGVVELCPASALALDAGLNAAAY